LALDDLDIVREFVADLRRNRNDPTLRRETIERCFHPDAEWHTMRELPGGGVRRGREAVARELRDQQEAFGDFDAKIEDLRAIGDQAVTRLVLRSVTRGASVAVDMRVGNIWSFKEGKIYRVRAFRDPAEAVAVAEAEAAA
jgi:ketosteroid isomerase-like protein